MKTGSIVTLKTLPPFPTEEEIETLKINNQNSRLANDPSGLDFTHPEASLILPPDLIVLRWVNFHLRAAGYSKVVENLSGAFKNCFSKKI